MKQKQEKHIIDKTMEEWGQLETISRMVKFFGAQRFTEILGWSTLAAFFIWQEPCELRNQLQEKGLTESGLYRALRDLRRFGIAIETGAIHTGATLDPKDIPLRDMSAGVRVMRQLSTFAHP